MPLTFATFRPMAVAALALMVAGAPEAQAQNIFDRLFGGGARRGEFPPPPPTPQKARPAPKISAPSYYDYKVDSLVPVRAPQLAGEGNADSAAPADPAFAAAMSSVSELELSAEKDVAAAISQHYEAHPEFVWVENGFVNERARQAINMLGDAATHGLDPEDYAVAVPSSTYSSGHQDARNAQLARFELELSARVLRYVRDARRGRIDPNRISGYHDFAAKKLDLAEVLDRLERTPDTATYLASFHPQGSEYQALRVELEALRAAEELDVIVDPKLLLKPGGNSPELPKILTLIERKASPEFATKYAVELAVHRGKVDYAQDLVPLIKEAQEAHGLKGDGVIGPRTVAALAGVTKAARIDKVLVALEQLRWHPSELGPRRVFINQPAYTASYFENGQEKLSMRVVIGKTSNQTSFFQDEIEQIDYNPYWGVPQSIIVNEMLPRLRNDPGYLDRAGYEVTDSKGRRIPSAAINWGQYGAKVPYSVRQTPSEANALGELKILFPNKHAIYMHDTPQKALFNRDARAFSHGCVRLQQPREMAAAVLGTDVGYIESKLAKGHSTEKIPGKIPVYVAYFTAWPNKDGVVEYFADVYSRDERVLKALEKTATVRTPAA